MLIEKLGAAIVPLVIAICAVLILTSKKPMFERFTDGIRGGFETAIRLFPTLCALCCAAAMFSACGASEAIASLLERLGSPVLGAMAEFLVLRPVSGAASTAMLLDLFERESADALAAITASVIMASSDTLVYIISVYHQAAGIKKSRVTLPAAIITMVVTTAAAIFVCERLFG